MKTQFTIEEMLEFANYAKKHIPDQYEIIEWDLEQYLNNK